MTSTICTMVQVSIVNLFFCRQSIPLAVVETNTMSFFNEVSNDIHIFEKLWSLPIYFVLECVAKNEQFIWIQYECLMTSSVIFFKVMSKSICTETMLKFSNTLALEYCVNYFLTIDGLYNGANCKFISSGCWDVFF